MILESLEIIYQYAFAYYCKKWLQCCGQDNGTSQMQSLVDFKSVTKMTRNTLLAWWSHSTSGFMIVIRTVVSLCKWVILIVINIFDHDSETTDNANDNVIALKFINYYSRTYSRSDWPAYGPNAEHQIRNDNVSKIWHGKFLDMMSTTTTITNSISNVSLMLSSLHLYLPTTLLHLYSLNLPNKLCVNGYYNTIYFKTAFFSTSFVSRTSRMSSKIIKEVFWSWKSHIVGSLKKMS